MSCGIIVFIVFLILKLVEVIDWHWFWVYSPLIAELIVDVLLVLLVVYGKRYLHEQDLRSTKESRKKDAVNREVGIKK